MVADVLKLSLHGGGLGVRISWGVYNALLSSAALLLSGFLSITGWRLRNEINQFEVNQKNPTFVVFRNYLRINLLKISIMALTTSIAFVGTCFSLVLWIALPELFGSFTTSHGELSQYSFVVYYSLCLDLGVLFGRI